MSRNSHTPRTFRCTVGTSGRDRIQAQSRHRSEQTFVTGILTCHADFERARPWGLTDAADFDSYLLDTAVLLAEAQQAYGSVQARMFHPGDFADFCLLQHLDPAETAARDRYLLNPALRTQLLPYQGEELSGDFIPRLVRARENGLTLRHIDLLLDGSLYSSPKGAQEAPDPRVRSAFEQGGELFRRMLVGAGCGAYQFRCAVEAPGGRLTADARILHWEDGVVRLNDEDLDLVRAVFCAGLALELPGVAALYGSQGGAGSCGEYRQVAWAWQSTGFGWAPARLNLGEVVAEPGFTLGSVC
ncbi:hypothetical protein [Saccharothrix sp. ST-888]|uniref:hypothetical protein n=1 Tax=Saccharothrix sp. ST-888 TaxID=1427391 RepID=UPI0005EC622F|nr:hypothetical protein [Saccharothrix sp. ST-888]KJK57004.1 hypothetical protein UK12_19120 [Saccharothrix sp. ST-888]